MKNIDMGIAVVDTISGLKGVVTAKCEYITGCVQYLIAPKLKKDESYSDGHWIDDMRLEIVPKAKCKKVASRRTGFGPKAPTRYGAK